MGDTFAIDRVIASGSHRSSSLSTARRCIYRKDILPAELKTFLVDRYGMDESLENPEEEPEDTHGASG